MTNTDRLSGPSPSVLVMSRNLPHPPAKVWRAITEPAHLAHWFPDELGIEGDKIVFGSGEPGRITDLDEPRVFAFTWGEDHLRWELHPRGEHTLLTLTHTFGDHYGAASFASGWHTCIAHLAAHLSGHDAPELDSVALHEDYLHHFGLHHGRRDGGGVRFERQLTRTAEQVWQLLDGEQASIGAPPPPAFRAPGVPAAPVTTLQAARLLGFDGVRWELGEGTGHGARLILTHTDPDTLTTWQDHLDSILSQ